MDRKTIVIIGVALIVFLTFFIFVRTDNTIYDWSENYKTEGKNPYGLHIIHSVLKNYSGNDSGVMLEDILEEMDTNATNQNYLTIGQAIRLDTSELDHLFRFVENGNNAFISSKTIPGTIADEIFPEICDDYNWTDYITSYDSVSTLNLSHPSLVDSMGYDYRFFRSLKPVDYRWSYIDPDYFCAEEYSPQILGTIDNYYPNFARVKYGNGNFYLHTTPLAFTNIQMLDELGLAYASRVFSHMNAGITYIDTKHLIPERLGRRLNDQEDYFDGADMEGPLQFLFRHASLKYAWYLLLFMGLLFLLFRMKRRQRIIPIIPPNKNSSLSFISTIGSLYFLQKDNKRLARQMAKLFLGYVRENYDLATHTLDFNFTKRLVGKSEIPEYHLEKIVKQIKGIKGVNAISDDTLIDFHKNLNYFYRNSK